MANLISWLLRAQRAPALSWGARQILALYGVEFPPSVAYGSGLNIVHRGFGLVVSPFVTFGAHVTVYHGVTLGRSDSWVPLAGREAPSIAVEDHAVLCPGAKVLATPGDHLRVAVGSVVGANAVLTRSTGPWEIWAGVPAKKVGERTDRS